MSMTAASLLGEALQLARDIPDPANHIWVLTEVARRLPEGEQRTSVLQEALEAVRKVADKGQRPRLLVQIVACLAAEPPHPKRSPPLPVEAERDCYLQALYALTRKPVAFTEDEIAALRNSPLTLEKILEE